MTVEPLAAPTVSGPELQAMRLQAGITVSGLARRYGVARQRVQAIEGRVAVPHGTVRRYLQALHEEADAMKAELERGDR